MSTSSQNPLSGQQLIDISTRAEAATAGPWCTDSWEIYQGAEYVAGAMWIGETCRGGTTTLDEDRADAAFVAAARTDVPLLLDEIERLQRAYTFDTAELKRQVDQALNDAIEAARSEYLTDNTGTPEDEAYNQGVTDVIAAIGELLDGGAR